MEDFAHGRLLNNEERSERFKKSLKIPKVDQNPQIEEQTTQWSKEKEQNDK
jgi:hypothetical protein